MVPPGCGGCGRNAAVLPQGLRGRGVGAKAAARVHAGRPAVPLGACRCSRSSVVVPVVPPRLVTALPGCGPGRCVCQRCAVVLRPRVSRFAVVAGSTGRFLLQSPQGTSWPAGPGRVRPWSCASGTFSVGCSCHCHCHCRWCCHCLCLSVTVYLLPSDPPVATSGGWVRPRSQWRSGRGLRAVILGRTVAGVVVGVGVA